MNFIIEVYTVVVDYNIFRLVKIINILSTGYRQPPKNDSNDISLGRSKVEVLWTVRRFDGSYFNTKCSISVQIAH